MTANKTKENEVDVSTFIAQVPDMTQRTDADTLIALLKRLSGAPPKMWGPSIVGFGRYHYRYDSGHEGEMCRIGFSPRKGQTVLYIMGGFPRYAEIMARLGKHKTGKGCLYIKRLTDVSMAALEELCAASLSYMADKYPPGD
jgi:Domain of unknown function (DU1801)